MCDFKGLKKKPGQRLKNGLRKTYELVLYLKFLVIPTEIKFTTSRFLMSHDRGSLKFLCLPQLPLLVGGGGRINPQAVSQSTIDCRKNMFQWVFDNS